jgi:cyclophilin family peptidyl-prolyl cis-trans isomerase
LTDRQRKLVVNLPPEFNDTKHERGVVSMARGDDPASAQTSFFICTAAAAALDGKYTAFGRVVEGLDVVAAIESAPRTGETPDERIELQKVSVIP